MICYLDNDTSLWSKKLYGYDDDTINKIGKVEIATTNNQLEFIKNLLLEFGIEIDISSELDDYGNIKIDESTIDRVYDSIPNNINIDTNEYRIDHIDLLTQTVKYKKRGLSNRRVSFDVDNESIERAISRYNGTIIIRSDEEDDETLQSTDAPDEINIGLFDDVSKLNIKYGETRISALGTYITDSLFNDQQHCSKRLMRNNSKLDADVNIAVDLEGLSTFKKRTLLSMFIITENCGYNIDHLDPVGDLPWEKFLYMKMMSPYSTKCGFFSELQGYMSLSEICGCIAEEIEPMAAGFRSFSSNAEITPSNFIEGLKRYSNKDVICRDEKQSDLDADAAYKASIRNEFTYIVKNKIYSKKRFKD